MHHLHPLIKRPRTSDNSARGYKNSLLGFIWSSNSKVKILPHHVYRSFEGKIYTDIWGRNQHEFCKKRVQNAPFASDYQKCSRGRPSRAQTCRSGIPLPYPSSSGALRRFRLPPPPPSWAVDPLDPPVLHVTRLAFTWSDFKSRNSIARCSHGSVSVH